jgi:hypothetical protein
LLGFSLPRVVLASALLLITVIISLLTIHIWRSERASLRFTNWLLKKLGNQSLYRLSLIGIALLLLASWSLYFLPETRGIDVLGSIYL